MLFPHSHFFHLSVMKELWLERANTSLCGHYHPCGQTSHGSRNRLVALVHWLENREDIRGMRLGTREKPGPIPTLPLVLVA